MFAITDVAVLGQNGFMLHIQVYGCYTTILISDLLLNVHSTDGCEFLINTV